MASADGTVWIIGAGLAGLAASLSLAGRGRRVVVCESAKWAGGRCRSYFDRALGCRIDNGNHLLLSGNRATFDYLRQIGAEHTLTGPGRPLFPFFDVTTGARWLVRPNQGRLPWWLFAPGRRVPGTTWRDIIDLIRLRRAGEHATIADSFRRGDFYRRLVEPLAIAALNTMPDVASARLFGAVMAQSLGQGGRACIPWFPLQGLSESFIDPAIDRLRRQGAETQMPRRATGFEFDGDRVSMIQFADGPQSLEPSDTVILATPATVALGLVPGLKTPTAFESIANLHFRVDTDPDKLHGQAGFAGLVGGLAEWVFVRPGIVSVTISAANRYVTRDDSDLAATVWQELRHVLHPALSACVASAMPDRMSMHQPFTPQMRVVREKRATFMATPEQDCLRPRPATPWRNLLLAGDWVATGLPSTIEGAIRSGRIAADLILDAA